MPKSGDLTVQMDEILDWVQKETRDAAEKNIQKIGKECAQKLRNTSPKGSPHRRKYAEGWTIKKVDAKTVIVHNKTNYQLTHLLENGHIIKNKKGTYGRTHPIKHIAPVAEWANGELPRRILEDIP